MCLLHRHQDLPQHFIQRLHGVDLHPLPRGMDIVIHDAKIHHIQPAPDLTGLGVENAADRKSTRLNSSHWNKSRMPSSA